MYVCEALLSNAKKRSGRIGGQRWEFRWCVQFGADSGALLETVDVPGKRSTQAHQFKFGRVEQVGNGPDFLDDGVKGAHGVIERRTFLNGMVALEFGDAHLCSNEPLTHAVMKFTANLAAVIVLRLQDAGG